MRKMFRVFLPLALVLALFGTLEAKNAKAQGTTRVFASCNSATWNVLDVGRPLQILPDGTLCVNASVSASIAGFTPNGNYNTLTATAATSASTALPSGAVVAMQNTSTVDVSCVLAAGVATATTNKIVVRGGSTIFVTVGSNVNTACINQTGVASNLVAMAGGTGLGTGFGGGGAGGGGGGAVTVADGADVNSGTTTDAAATAGGTGTIAAKQRLMTTQLASVITQETALNTVFGTTADAVCGTATGTCTLEALIKYLNQQTSIPLNNSSVPINVSTATTTQLVAISGSTLVYVTSYDVIAGGTGNITFVYGTGSNCGTGTTSLTGAYPLTAQAGISKGSGIGTVLKVPAGNALCVTTSAAVQMSGSVSYQQF